eukprot:scaffold7349_cov173-Amphora_coffeaeformis.AAC.56
MSPKKHHRSSKKKAPRLPATLPQTLQPKVLTVVSSLNEHDVIMGRGNKVGKFAGNLNFRRVCWKHKARYLRACKEEKSKIAFEVLDEIGNLDPPGRFLEPQGGYYVFVHPKRALEKTCQLLREKKVKKPDGMESLPMQRIQVNKSLRRRKPARNLSDEEDEQEMHRPAEIVSSVASKAKKTVRKKKTQSKPKHIAKGSHDKAITVTQAIKSIGKTPRRSQRQGLSKSAKKERVAKIEKEDAQEGKVQAQVTFSGSFKNMSTGDKTRVSSPLIHPVTPSSGFYFGTPATQPVMAFEAEHVFLPEDPADDKPMELLLPGELLRGLSDYTFRNESEEDFEDGDFESELEKITEPPLLTSFSSRCASLCSVHLAFEHVANTFENNNRGSPNGVIDISGPPMLKSQNSLFIDEIDAGESERSAIPYDIFEDERDSGVKRKLWY